MVGSLTLPCSKLVMQPCGLQGTGNCFPVAKDWSPLERGGFVEGCFSARGLTLSPTPAVLAGQPGHLHLPREGTQRCPVSHTLQ